MLNIEVLEIQLQYNTVVTAAKIRKKWRLESLPGSIMDSILGPN